MRRIQQFYSIIIFTFACTAGALFGETYPQTNTLVAEIKVAPPEIAVGGEFGQFLAAKSNVFVASYKNAVAVGPRTPTAAVFKKTNTGFEQQATLFVPIQANLSLQGLATDGNEIAIFGVEGGTSVIYIFGRQQEEWLLETRLLPSERIGSISISDGVMVAGAAFKALVFESKTGEWTENPILPPDVIPGVVRNGFGAAVSVNHGTIIITAVGDIRSDPGRAYVYVRNEDTWLLEAELRPDDYIYAKFGSAVSLDADTALVSVYPTAYNSGMVYLFQRAAGAWSRIGNLPGGAPQEFFGHSVAVSGRNLMVGAPWARAGSGCVYLFRRNGANFDRLQLYRNDTLHDPMSLGDSLGYDVAADGNSFFFSAPYHDTFAEDAGVAFLFTFEFTPMLEFAWARPADNSFHFNIADTRIGQTYSVETTSRLDSEWITLKQLTADRLTTQVEVDIPACAVGFFRVSNAETK